MKTKFTKFCIIGAISLLSVIKYCHAEPFNAVYQRFLVEKGYIGRTSMPDMANYLRVKELPSWKKLAEEFTEFCNSDPNLDANSLIKPDRIVKDCRVWFNWFTNFNYKIGPWKEDEDQFIMEKMREIGPKWEIMSTILHRTPNSIKNRWSSELRHRVDSSSNFLGWTKGRLKLQQASKIKLKAPLSSISNDDKEIIYSYSNSCGYFNNFLRNDDTSYHGVRHSRRTIQKDVDTLSSLISSNKIDTDNVVFRGIDGFGMKILLEKHGINVDLDEIQRNPQANPIYKLEGKIISDPAFLSTSDIKGYGFSNSYPFMATGEEEHDRISSIVTNALFRITLNKGQCALPTHKVIKEYNRLHADGTYCEGDGNYEDEYEVILPPGQNLKIHKVIPHTPIDLAGEYNYTIICEAVN